MQFQQTCITTRAIPNWIDQINFFLLHFHLTEINKTHTQEKPINFRLVCKKEILFFSALYFKSRKSNQNRTFLFSFVAFSMCLARLLSNHTRTVSNTEKNGSIFGIGTNEQHCTLINDVKRHIQQESNECATATATARTNEQKKTGDTDSTLMCTSCSGHTSKVMWQWHWIENCCFLCSFSADSVVLQHLLDRATKCLIFEISSDFFFVGTHREYSFGPKRSNEFRKIQIMHKNRQ